MLHFFLMRYLDKGGKAHFTAKMKCVTQSHTPLLSTHNLLQPPFFDFRMEGGGAGGSPSVVFRASIKAS